MTGLFSALAAPAIVRAASLMPVKPMIFVGVDTATGSFSWIDYSGTFIVPGIDPAMSSLLQARIEDAERIMHEWMYQRVWGEVRA